MTAPDKKELDWAVATRPLPGQLVNGDQHLVTKTTEGWLLAVADGLGHGPQAAAASNLFIAVLKSHKDETPVNLIRLGHEALIGTRGIACTIMTINSRQNLLRWIGVGNVEGVVRHTAGAAAKTEYVTLRGGVVGYRLPALQASCLTLFEGDIIALATDGIGGDFVNSLSPAHPPATLADRLLKTYAKPLDDALILTAGWRSVPAGQKERVP